MSASTSNRRHFLASVLSHLVETGLASSLTSPSYGADTVYRLEVPGTGPIAIIQKGCPDGAHSSSRWTAPEWAQEVYLWWMCSSMKSHPGEHVVKGINRLRQRFESDPAWRLTGVIFHNELCGSVNRPCPKQSKAIEIAGRSVPPPCVYLVPESDEASSTLNWTGERKAVFPAILMRAFGIDDVEQPFFEGYVGFQRRNNADLRTSVTIRFGAGRSSTYRS